MEIGICPDKQKHEHKTQNSVLSIRVNICFGCSKEPYLGAQKNHLIEMVLLSTVKAPNIAHLSLLTSVGYNNKETKWKKCIQPNKVIITYYLHTVQNEKKNPNL